MPLVRRALSLAFAVALVCACGRGNNGPQQAPLPVTAVPAKAAQIPVYIEHVGTTESVNTIEVRARVQGVLEKVLFKEGADVEKNALLFVIEQKPYEAAFAKAKAALEGAKATAERTQADYARTEELEKKDVASKSDLDHARAARDEAAAAVDGAKAALDQAQLDLSYTEVRAPISGRISRVRATQGNLVGATEQTVLTTLVQLDPIYIYWSPSEKERLDVLRLRKEGLYVQRDEIEVRATLADGNEYPYAGRLDFVDNAVDPTAGTLRVRAVFPNPEKSILPGQYANLHILVGRDVPVILVPAQAILEEQGGSSVFVVGDDDTVQSRAIVAGATTGDQMRVVDSGVKAGEKIAVDNLGKLRPGMKVTPKVSDSLAEAKPAAGAPVADPPEHH
ncbi:MAG TPA: efflux RND transporter periplasmic adaptor subunit [Myxococcota bacterium]|nr:efflux RND transporter periplasmic adaptor subunit [Myxococcota bacterium]